VTSPAFRAVQLDDIDPVPVLDGQLLWRPLRATLGVRAFGVNAYTARAAGDLVVEEHDERGTGSGHHEELYVVVAGHARFTIGDLMLVTVLRELRGTEGVDEFPNLSALVKRGEARPAFQRALSDQLAVFREHEPQGEAA